MAADISAEGKEPGHTDQQFFNMSSFRRAREQKKKK
jgi:hypothetical protein